ncbi:MAG: lysylphosphatidylglycerol synthase transmembrane domain-containing protein [Thermoprotei archaeon]
MFPEKKVLMADKKLIASALLPPIIVIAYSLYFKVDPIGIIYEFPPYFLFAFLGSYLASNAVASLRDYLLAKVPYRVALKARLLGNAVSLLIPGALGADLTRALVYTEATRKRLEESLAVSTVSAFYDVVIGSLMYLALLIVRPSLFDLIYALIAVGNVLFWFVVIGYAAGTAKLGLNRVERMILGRLKDYPEVEAAYLRAKEVIRTRNAGPLVLIYSLLTVLQFLIQAIPLVFVFKSYLIALMVNQLYFVSLLVLIPAGAISSEIALSSVLPPLYAIGIRTLELISYASGFVFIKDLNLKQMEEELRRYGKVPKRAPKGEG